MRYSNFGLETAQNPDSLRIFADTVGAKTYEFSNHLGNVLATLSDKKMLTGAYYSAIVNQAGFYYPFGWEIPTLQYSGGYRYGFNGVEKSPEIDGGHNTTFYREQDTRVGTWWSFDPHPNPSVAPYTMMENNPIWGSDVLGDTVDLDFLNKESFDRVEYLRERVPLFNTVYTKLDAHPNTYRVKHSAEPHSTRGTDVKAQLEPYSAEKGYGEIIFYESEIANLSIFEEFFHAYQETFYGELIPKSEIAPANTQRRFISEWEAEAKVARAMMEIELAIVTLDVKTLKNMYEISKKDDDIYSRFYIGGDALGKDAAIQIYENHVRTTGNFYIPKINNKQNKTIYSAYLEGFESFFDGKMHSYSGEQRPLSPDAFNSLIK